MCNKTEQNMKTKTSYLLVTLLLLSTSIAFGQKCRTKLQSQVSIDILPNGSETSPMDIVGSFFDILSQKLSSRNILVSANKPNVDYQFLIGLKELSSAKKTDLIASILIMQKLPEGVVNLAVKEDLFYKLTGEKEKPKNLTEEGSQIREMVSRDYITQFGLIENYFVGKIKLTELDKFCDKVVRSFLSTRE